ncbi:MAG TPA: hypothetical protein PLH57_10515 [Oligoflexia bacterium]|nr:hypothetical protein [Oligoflexia bacterium]
MNDLYSIASELVTERKMLLEAVKRLERSVRIVDETPAHQSVAALHESIGRVGGLLRAILQLSEMNQERDFGAVARAIESRLRDHGKKISKNVDIVFADPTAVKADAAILDKITTPLIELFICTLDYGVETERERLLRGKKKNTVFRINAVPCSAGILMTVNFDGNGVIPPLSLQQSRQLGAAGIRLEFQGTPGVESSWRVIFSSSQKTIKCIRAVVDGVECAIPLWSSFGIKKNVTVTRGTLYSLTRDWNLRELPQGSKVTYLITMGAGSAKKNLVLDDMHGADDVLIRELPPALLAGGKVLGLAVWSDTSANMVRLLPVIDPNWIAHSRSGE